MNYLKYVGIFVIGAAVCSSLAVGVNAAVNHFDKPSTHQAATCNKKGQDHLVVMHGNNATPNQVTAKLCDALTIKNVDDQIRLVAFGAHEHHIAYDNVLERTLQKDQSLTITLNKAGTYQFHDHLDDSAKGTFTVH